MTRTTWLTTQAALLLVAFGPWLPSFAAHADEVPIRLSADLDLTGAQQSSLAIQAMKGSPEAARKLATYHFIVRGDREASLKWYTIGADNGDPTCAYNLAGLLKVSSDEQEHARGIFWLHKAADGGVSYQHRRASEQQAQTAHVRAVEDRAHAEVDRAREEAKSLQATLHRRERELADGIARLEATLASARAAEQMSAERGARASALEEQLTRMDGLPAALLAAQRALAASRKREAALQAKLSSRSSKSKEKPLGKKA